MSGLDIKRREVYKMAIQLFAKSYNVSLPADDVKRLMDDCWDDAAIAIDRLWELNSDE